MRFRAVLGLHGKTATGIEVPEEVVTGLGSGRRPAVRATLDGYTYRTTIAPMGGKYFLGVSAEHRTAAGLTAGDQVEVVLELDTAPREVTLPDDLARALDAAGARPAFDALSYTYRKEHVRSVEDAKMPQTRQRRIDAVVAKLAAR
jgi:hypothetical protein